MRTPMSAAGLESIDHTVVLTRAWIDELDTSLGWCNKHRSYRLLQAVLRTLRDWLPPHEVAPFGAELPQLLRGVYYDGWRPAAAPMRRRGDVDFMAAARDTFASEACDLSPETVAAVFLLLTDKLSGDAGEAVHGALPVEMRSLWPLARQAA